MFTSNDISIELFNVLLSRTWLHIVAVGRLSWRCCCCCCYCHRRWHGERHRKLITFRVCDVSEFRNCFGTHLSFEENRDGWQAKQSFNKHCTYARAADTHTHTHTSTYTPTHTSTLADGEFKYVIRKVFTLPCAMRYCVGMLEQLGTQNEMEIKRQASEMCISVWFHWRKVISSCEPLFIRRECRLSPFLHDAIRLPTRWQH